MRILVVTDIRLYREGVAAALRTLPDVECAVTAGTGAAAILTVRRLACDVVLLDLALEESSQVALALAAARPDVHVVALGVKEDGPSIVACAEAGVSGYVPREASLDDLARALRAVMRGEAACSGKVAAGLIRYIAHQARLRERGGAAIQFQFTRREREVLRLLEADMSNKEIARALGLRLSTVKNHVHNVLAKLHASCRADIPRILNQLHVDPVPNLVPDQRTSTEQA